GPWLRAGGPRPRPAEPRAAAGLLTAQKPAERPPVLVPAAFHSANMLFRDGQVVALLDWEIAQLGQPLLDLACLAVVAHASRTGEDRVPGGGAAAWPAEALLATYRAQPGGLRCVRALRDLSGTRHFGY